MLGPNTKNDFTFVMGQESVYHLACDFILLIFNVWPKCLNMSARP